MFSAERMDREADRAADAVRQRAESLIRVLDDLSGESPIDIPEKPSITVDGGSGSRSLVLSQTELGHLHEGVMTLGARVDMLMRILRSREEVRVKHHQTPV